MFTGEGCVEMDNPWQLCWTTGPLTWRSQEIKNNVSCNGNMSISYQLSSSEPSRRVGMHTDCVFSCRVGSECEASLCCIRLSGKWNRNCNCSISNNSLPYGMSLQDLLILKIRSPMDVLCIIECRLDIQVIPQ